MSDQRTHHVIVGFEGGRMGRCLIEGPEGLLRVSPREAIRSKYFAELDAEDRERIHWLARRQDRYLQSQGYADDAPRLALG